MSPTLTALAASASAAARLVLFRDVLSAPPGQAFLHLAAGVFVGDDARVLAAYADLLARLIAAAAAAPAAVPDPWQDHLLDAVVYDANPFTHLAQAVPVADLPAGLVAAARHDLVLLQQLFGLDGERVRAALSARNGALPLPDVAWHTLTSPATEDRADVALKRALAAAPSWPDALDLLAAHLRGHGAGPLARFVAYRWQHDGGPGRLVGVARPDPIRLHQLVGYERQRAHLLRNTEQFVAGFPANNVLLYGDRGTGKSSLVKALLHAYAPRGLRLVEMPKQRLGDFPALFAALAERPQLEGSVEARPPNVLLYATSNRRHLVREHHRDRKLRFGADDEVQPQDTVQEQLSLADRFGIVLIFRAPDREEYLAIVRALAEQAGLDLPPADLEQRALRWATWHGGRTGRSARQFVDQLTGELLLERRGPSQ
ncbi:MAG: ATP-binding protein [Chloroflexi bacterium]|nr:ATP-binding protein [Chloroflexota bacterium]